jgi:hypothetical protein
MLPDPPRRAIAYTMPTDLLANGYAVFGTTMVVEDAAEKRLSGHQLVSALSADELLQSAAVPDPLLYRDASRRAISLFNILSKQVQQELGPCLTPSTKSAALN